MGRNSSNEGAMSNDEVLTVGIKSTRIAPAEVDDGGDKYAPDGEEDKKKKFALVKEAYVLERTTQFRSAKATFNTMNSIHGFAGLMAGFQGFIINEYVNVTGKSSDTSDKLDPIFEWGLFLMAISFALHIQSAILAFLWGLFIQEGLWRPWFMTRVGRTIKLMVTLGVGLFVLSVCLFVWTMNFRPGFYIAIYIVAGVFLTSGMGLFVYTMFEMMMEDPKKTGEIMDLINDPVD